MDPELKNLLGQIISRLDGIDGRLDGMDGRLTRVENILQEHTKILQTHSEYLADHQDAIQRLALKLDDYVTRNEFLEYMDAILGKQTKLEDEQTILRHQFQRHEQLPAHAA